MRQYGEMGTCFCHHRSELLSGERTTRTAAAEGCLEDRAPGRQVVAQRWHMRRMLPLLHSAPISCPHKDGLLLPSSKRSQTKRSSATTVTNEGHCPHPVTKPCHLPVTSQGSGLRAFAPAVKEGDLSVEHLLVPGALVRYR